MSKMNRTWVLEVTKKTGAVIKEEFVGKSYASVVGRAGWMFPGSTVRKISGPHDTIPKIS